METQNPEIADNATIAIEIDYEGNALLVLVFEEVNATDDDQADA